ncbi:hypothetical protein MMC31_002633 [Peltigera leucophlebia]|nr:hypothetical protein [Peltigera leucophlebia]
MSRGNGTQDKENFRKERGQKRRIEAITELEDSGNTSQESGSPPAKKVRASPKLNDTAQEATCPVQGSTARSDKSPSEASTRHNPSEAKGSDTVPVPTIQPPVTKGPATLPLPPTKDKKVRKSMRGVASIKPRALPEPSAQPQVSTRPAGAQGPPSWVLQEHLEWIEQEVTRRVAAAFALSKNENAPATRAGAPYNDAGTQVDAVVLAAGASGAGITSFCIEKKTAKRTKRVKGANKQLPTTASEQAVPKPERKAARSAEQAVNHFEEPRKSRHSQSRNQQLKGNPGPPNNQNPLVDPQPATKKVRNMALLTTEGRASAAPKAVNPTKSQSSNPAPKKNHLPGVPSWFQMLQPPSSKRQP